MKEIKEEIREKDGKRYIVRKCPGCGKELLFKVREQTIRLYCACAECGRKMEVEVIGEDYFEMLQAEEELKKAEEELRKKYEEADKV